MLQYHKIIEDDTLKAWKMNFLKTSKTRKLGGTFFSIYFSFNFFQITLSISYSAEKSKQPSVLAKCFVSVLKEGNSVV